MLVHVMSELCKSYLIIRFKGKNKLKKKEEFYKKVNSILIWYKDRHVFFGKLNISNIKKSRKSNAFPWQFILYYKLHNNCSCMKPFLFIYVSYAKLCFIYVPFYFLICYFLRFTGMSLSQHCEPFWILIRSFPFSFPLLLYLCFHLPQN